jgi:hypothetical protein
MDRSTGNAASFQLVSICYTLGDVLFFERMLADRAVTLRNTVLLYSFRFLSK